MKIAIDISQIVHEGSGVATYTDQLVKNLLKIDKQNEYLLFGISLRKHKFMDNYFLKLRKLHQNLSSKFFYIPPSIGEFLGNRLHIINIETLTGRIDVFHSSDWIQPSAQAKKVTTVHDLLVYDYPDISHPYIVQTQKRRLHWVKKECDRVLTDSFFTKNRLMKIMQFENSKISVVYPGISAIYNPASKENIKYIQQKYGLFDNYILSVGTQEPRKNIKSVLLAFDKFLDNPMVSSSKNPIQLVIAGKFGWGEKLERNKYVRLLGLVEEKDLPALYSGATFFVYPSFYEGFGFPVLEAMACGCPVITSGRGSLKELSKDCALIVDPEMKEDITLKMTQLFVDKDLKVSLIKKGKENAQKFNWENTAKEVLKVYTELKSE